MADQQQIHDSNTAINNAAKEALFVIKIGGNIIDDASKLNNFLKQFTDIQGKKILVHGVENLLLSWQKIWVSNKKWWMEDVSLMLQLSKLLRWCMPVSSIKIL